MAWSNVLRRVTYDKKWTALPQIGACEGCFGECISQKGYNTFGSFKFVFASYFKHANSKMHSNIVA